jgi:hypothetical protein
VRVPPKADQPFPAQTQGLRRPPRKGEDKQRGDMEAYRFLNTGGRFSMKAVMPSF